MLSVVWTVFRINPLLRSSVSVQLCWLSTHSKSPFLFEESQLPEMIWQINWFYFQTEAKSSEIILIKA